MDVVAVVAAAEVGDGGDAVGLDGRQRDGDPLLGLGLGLVDARVLGGDVVDGDAQPDARADAGEDEHDEEQELPALERGDATHLNARERPR